MVKRTANSMKISRERERDSRLKVVTETTDRKEKTKLRSSIFNLENNKNTEHSFPVTRSSTDSPKVALKAISINVGNKHC